MKRVNNYTIKKESFEDMLTEKRFNPGLEFTFQDQNKTHTHKLNAGYCDDISVYRENRQTFILTNNPYLGYVSMQVFNGGEETEDLFLEYHQLVEILGSCDLAPITMIRRLRNHLYS